MKAFSEPQPDIIHCRLESTSFVSDLFRQIVALAVKFVVGLMMFTFTVIGITLSGSREIGTGISAVIGSALEIGRLSFIGLAVFVLLVTIYDATMKRRKVSFNGRRQRVFYHWRRSVPFTMVYEFGVHYVRDERPDGENLYTLSAHLTDDRKLPLAVCYDRDELEHWIGRLSTLTHTPPFNMEALP